MLDALTLDQIDLFLIVVETGSFSGAARHTRRSASAVTYMIQKMEQQLGVELFDRSSYRAALTEAGKNLLPRARRVSAEMKALRVAARGMASGLEADLSLAVDSMFPMSVLSRHLELFQHEFPTVQLRLFVETFGVARQMVENKEAIIGLTSDAAPDNPAIIATPILSIELVLVASPRHPLTQVKGPIDTDALREHRQLVVTDRSRATTAHDWSVYSGTTWRLGDIHTKHSLLKSGIGFGSMPHHMVRDDLEHGTLVPLNVTGVSEMIAPIPIALIQKADTALGPAARWLSSRLSSSSEPEQAI